MDSAPSISTTAPQLGEHHPVGRAAKWFSWLIGAAVLAAVVIAGLHFSEERELARIAQRAQPWWLALALVLQLATYVAQGETWRVVTRAAGVAVPSSVAFKLSLAKLFIDQALPSGGLSGTVVVASALKQRGIASAVVMAAVVVDSVSYYAACVVTLAVALFINLQQGALSPLILAAALFFLFVCVVLATTALLLAGRTEAGARWLVRVPLLNNALTLLKEADPKLVRSAPLIFKSGLLQVAIILLDAATVWILIRSLGELASPSGVFASFVVSTLLRTISIVPGGLGIFEAASVVTLKFVGVPVATALAATLLFRGLSFWFPMLPGLIISRSVRKVRPTTLSSQASLSPQID